MKSRDVEDTDSGMYNFFMEVLGNLWGACKVVILCTCGDDNVLEAQGCARYPLIPHLNTIVIDVLNARP